MDDLRKSTECGYQKRGRRCPECGAHLKLSEYFTRNVDLWDCPKCGYWDSTKHR